MRRGIGARSRHSERGVMLVVGVLLMCLLAALATAFFSVVQKNSRQSRFYGDRTELRQYAESGVYLATHEMDTGVNGGDGNIGTETWTAAKDLGKDGITGTYDQGEGDGRPTPGEPGLTAAAVGASGRGISLLVRSVDSAWANVKKVTSTAFNNESAVTVEVYVKKGTSTVPRTPFYLDASIPLQQYDGNGVTGFDTNTDGTAGPESPKAGFYTSPGTPAGSNDAKIQSQIKVGEWPTVTGLGGAPSIEEVTQSIDVNALFDYYKAKATVMYSGSGLSLNNAYCGTWANPEITYFNGKKWTFSGSGRGGGVLLVDTEEYVNSGDMSFKGLVIIRLKTTMTLSGGPTPHVYGAMLVVPYSSAYHPVYKQSGGGKIVYSSQGLSWADSQFGANGTYQALHWSYPK